MGLVDATAAKPSRWLGKSGTCDREGTAAGHAHREPNPDTGTAAPAPACPSLAQRMLTTVRGFSAGSRATAPRFGEGGTGNGGDGDGDDDVYRHRTAARHVPVAHKRGRKWSDAFAVAFAV